MARRDDPRLGRREMVPSFSQFPFRRRHLLLEHPDKPGYLTVGEGIEVSRNDAVWTEARNINCPRCKPYLNV